MTQYTHHAVMIDETGCEFGVEVPRNRGGLSALEWLRDMYPESRVAQLETPEQTAEREDAAYRRASAEMDYGEDYYDYDEEEEDEDDFDDYTDEEKNERSQRLAEADDMAEDRHLDGMHEE